MSVGRSDFDRDQRGMVGDGLRGFLVGEDCHVWNAVKVLWRYGVADFRGDEDCVALKQRPEENAEEGLDLSMQIGRHAALQKFTFDILTVWSVERALEIDFGRNESLCRHSDIVTRFGQLGGGVAAAAVGGVEAAEDGVLDALGFIG